MQNNHNIIMEDISKPLLITPRKIFLSKIKRKLLSHVWLVRSGLVILFVGVIATIILLVGIVIKGTKLSSFATLAKNFIFVPQSSVKIIDDRVNILVMGKGGGSHKAPDLTDTMILASISIKDDKITLINLPRDIWISDLRTKLNSIYYWGNQKRAGGGAVLTKSVVEEISGYPIQYSVVIDFKGFTKFIDLLGGIEVDVENSFIDEKYPITGKEDDLCKEETASTVKLDSMNGDKEYKCRYETITFNKGKIKMDGETALKFVRSRNAEGDEGTDFARGARQEKVVLAMVRKILSINILVKPKRMIELKNEVVKYIETDITPKEGAFIARKIVSGRKNIFTLPFPEELLVNPPKLSKYDNLYVLVSKSGDWSEVKSWISCKLDGVGCK